HQCARWRELVSTWPPPDAPIGRGVYAHLVVRGELTYISRGTDRNEEQLPSLGDDVLGIQSSEGCALLRLLVRSFVWTNANAQKGGGGTGASPTEGKVPPREPSCQVEAVASVRQPRVRLDGSSAP